MEQKPREVREVDLIEVSVAASNFFRRHYRLLALCLIAGIGFGVLQFFNSRNDHMIKMMAHSTAVPNDVVVDLINSLQENIERGEYNKLVEGMNISMKMASQIYKIKAENGQGSPDLLRFSITFESRNSVDLDSIKSGLIYFINRQNYIRDRAQNYRQQQTQLIHMIDEKIIEYDSLKNIALRYTNLINNDRIFILNESKSYYKELVELYEKKLVAEKELLQAKEIEIIAAQQMTKSIKSKFSFIMISLSGVAFLLIGVVLSLLLELYEKVKAEPTPGPKTT